MGEGSYYLYELSVCLSGRGRHPPQHILAVGSIVLHLHLGHKPDNIISGRGLYFRHIPLSLTPTPCPIPTAPHLNCKFHFQTPLHIVRFEKFHDKKGPFFQDEHFEYSKLVCYLQKNSFCPIPPLQLLGFEKFWDKGGSFLWDECF